MDPLSNVLSLLKPKNHLAAGLDAGGDWSIRFPARQEGIKTGAVVSGAGWLSVEGVPDAVRLREGDCFLLPQGRSFRLASDLTLPPIEAAAVFGEAGKGGVACHNGGGDFSLVSNRFALTGRHGDILLRMLPPVVHVRDRAGQAALRWSIERMMQELRTPEPGGALIVQHLAHMMLAQALRLHLTQGSGTGVGWFFALADRQMNAAMSAMHDDPAQRWTLQSLSARAGMSRSSFALKFKAMVGTSPIDYLAHWRMLLAGERLETSNDPISRIAPSLGYESEAAFSTAFKRVMGCSPRQYGRDRAPVALSSSEGEGAYT